MRKKDKFANLLISRQRKYQLRYPEKAKLIKSKARQQKSLVEKGEITMYMVINKNRKKAIPEKDDLRERNNPKWSKYLKSYLTFSSRKIAMRWVNFWIDGKEIFRVVAVRIRLDPLERLVTQTKGGLNG